MLLPKNPLHIVGMATDAYTLRLQQEVLNARERALTHTPPENVKQVDNVYFTDLRDVSPDKLAPVLVKRNHDEWFVGFLIQAIGTGGMRLLVKDDKWRITRVKQSATVIRIGERLKDHHVALVEEQCCLRRDLGILLSRVQPCKSMKSKKVLKAADKLKSPKDKDSSREGKSTIC